MYVDRSTLLAIARILEHAEGIRIIGTSYMVLRPSDHFAMVAELRTMLDADEVDPHPECPYGCGHEACSGRCPNCGDPLMYADHEAPAE